MKDFRVEKVHHAYLNCTRASQLGMFRYSSIIRNGTFCIRSRHVSKLRSLMTVLLELLILLYYTRCALSE